jgi:cullin-associated NEDD8-dissociated protein 1
MDPLESALASNQLATISTCVTSFKYSAHNNQNQIHFKPFVPMLVKLVANEDLGVKKCVYEALTEICFNHDLSYLLTDFVPDLVEACIQDTVVKKELISQVDLGPFKYTVDNGAPIRKAAFNLMEVMVFRFSFNQSKVVEQVINGFVDQNEDVQFVCLNLMIKLANSCPVIVLNKLDSIVDKMQTLYKKYSPSLKKADA